MVLNPTIMCESCGRALSRALLRCPRRKSGECSYEVFQERLAENRRRGLRLIGCGVLLLVVILYFPALNPAPERAGIAGMMLRTLVLAAGLLGSGMLLAVGCLHAFAARIVVYSRQELQSWEGLVIGNTELRTRLLSDARTYPLVSVPEPKLRCAASILAMGDVARIMQARTTATDAAASEAERREALRVLVQAAGEVWEAALFRLVQEQVLLLRVIDVYESSGKRVELMSVGVNYLLFPGEEAERYRPDGLLERRIVETVRDWPQQRLAREEPLAPTAALLFRAAVEPGAAHPALALLEAVAGDGITRDIFAGDGSFALAPDRMVQFVEDRAAFDQWRQEVRSKNPEVAQAIESAFGKVIEEAEVSPNRARLAGGGKIKPKHLRIAAGVFVFLAVVLWRFTAPVAGVTALTKLIADLDAANPTVRQQALAALNDRVHLDELQRNEALHDRFLHSAERLLRDSQRYLGREALDTLARLDTPQAQRLVREYKDRLMGALRAGSSRARQAAAETLGSLGSRAEDAVGDLIGCLSDADPFVREKAVAALGRIGGDAQRVVPALIRAARDPNEITRSAAIYALGSFGQSAADAVPVLIDALTDSNSTIAAGAAESLGRIGAPAAPSVPALVDMVQRQEGTLRETAIGALRRIGGPEAQQALRRLGVG